MPTLRRRLRGVALAGACTALVVALAPAQAATKSPGAWMKPGVPMQGQQHPDPTAYTLGPITYVASTEHGGADLPVAWSADLRTFTARTQYAGDAGKRDGESRTGYFNDAIHNPPWGVTIPCGDASKGGCDPKSLWAPGIAYVGGASGKWLGYHAVKVSTGYSSYGRLAIYRTAAASPLGEFRSQSSKPIVTTDPKNDPAGVIDPEVFTEPTTGKTYLLYKTEGNTKGRYPKIWSRQITASGAFASGSKPKQLLTVSPGSWEGNVVENPSMVKVDGKYLLFYSGNRYATTKYATAYAVCTSPVGTCTKKGRVITNKSGSYGPGGADAFVDDRGRYVLAYHAWKSYSGTTGTGGRTLRMAEFAVEGGRVAIKQRELAPSIGSKDGYWYGNQGTTAFTRVERRTDGAYTPFVASLDGDGRDDVGLYGPWTADDASLVSTGTRGVPDFKKGNAEVGQAGTFLPVSGDFDGNGLTDVYWYQPGEDPMRQIMKEEAPARQDQLWLAKADGGWDRPASADRLDDDDRHVSQSRAAIPVVGNFDADAADEVWWVQPGSASDEKWDWNGKTFARSSASIPAPGTMAPAVGDLDGNGRDEVLWYGPGETDATIWWDGVAGSATKHAVGSVTQTYGRRPLVGDFDGNGKAEVLWYGPRSTADALWSDVTRASRKPAATAANQDQGGTYQGLVGDFDGDGVDDVYWYG